MKRKICLLFAILILSACGPTRTPDMDDDASVAPDGFAGPTDDAFVGPTDEEIIMANYEADVAAYQEEVGMPPEWATWMIEKKDWWSKAYISGRRDHEARVYVRYERDIDYDPPWPGETEAEREAAHFATLEYMAELQFPGWDFTFLEYYEGVEDDLKGNDVVAVLGHSGTSNASGHTIYLVYEAIFGHEFGHTIGLHHHYCGGTGSDQCPEAFPPGEDKCVMARNSASFGPTENYFLLQTTGERPDDEIAAIISDINSRYPAGYAKKQIWDECGTR